MIIITINDFNAAEELVAALKSKVPRAYILVRGHNAKQCENLLAMGADDVVSENLQASLELARLAFEHSQIAPKEFSDTIRGFKRDYYESIRQEKNKAAK
jgi:voltage-gated potassium channel Kch